MFSEHFMCLTITHCKVLFMLPGNVHLSCVVMEYDEMTSEVGVIQVVVFVQNEKQLDLNAAGLGFKINELAKVIRRAHDGAFSLVEGTRTDEEVLLLVMNLQYLAVLDHC